MDKGVIESLKAIVGHEYVSDSEVDLEVYSRVGSLQRRARSEVIVLPGSVEEVSKVLTFANTHKIPLVVKGAGENLQETAAPAQGGILLSLARMDRILEIDNDNLTIMVEGGCSTYTIFRELEQRGLRCPIIAQYSSGPQAASGVAGNYLGLLGARHGSCADHLMGLEVVLADGEVATFGTGAFSDYGYFYKYVGAPTPMSLFIQSLGTLGVITKVVLKIVHKPKFESYMTFAWSSEKLKEASQGFYDLMRFGVYNLDVWNKWAFWFQIKKGQLPPLPSKTEILALIIQDANLEVELKLKEDRIKEICRSYGGIDVGETICRGVFGPPEYRVWEYYMTRYRSTREFKARTAYIFYFVPILSVAEDYELFCRMMEKFGFWNERSIPRYRGWLITPAAFASYPAFYSRLDEEGKTRELIQEYAQELTKRGAMPYSVGPTWPKETVEMLGPQFELMRKIKMGLDPNHILHSGYLF